MELDEKMESRRHVIEKIKRISIAVDRRESIYLVVLTGLFAAMITALTYYIML
jgi:hypothetical protein